ncbi:outer membrane protein G [Buttiauxella brennerae ATCC 51605]|uniref:Outer membrane protein G n=1 Tax=Buttiauxella brennerae ATCC 51605 TaxID=1354251 RepID=A0A1B7IPT6_9ENTR|nr:OmpG family monomeric porin [Buttiauxella brennerae]OAT31746.1 outer membrane protein G [Buttiauxella brennerae ATCC 51605]
MKKLLQCTVLIACAGPLYVHAAENDTWHYNIGAMYEIENVEGQADDKDGLYEPSVYFNASYGAWTISMTMYQEGSADYSNFTRGTYFNRPELDIRYQIIDNDAWSLGFTGGMRNYGYHFKNDDGSNNGTANTQRYKFQPDWNVNINNDWSFSGWLAYFRFDNDLDQTGYSDSRVETETGFSWKINETVSVRANYYLERGFNTDSDKNNGEFSTQEIRAYVPISLGNTTLTPYTRLGLDRWTNWDWSDDIDREDHDYNRLGLLYAYDFQNGLSMTLEYAYEWENHDEGGNDKFHYAGIGVNYGF